MRSRVTALTRPGLFSARETVDAATFVSLAMSLMVTGRVRPASGAPAMRQGNHGWQEMANDCHVCRAAASFPCTPRSMRSTYGSQTQVVVSGRRDPPRGEPDRLPVRRQDPLQ